jgi:hypothetical protein
MQYCLFMHYQEGPEIGLTEEDMAPAREAFARYADDLDAAGVLVGTPTVQDGPFAETKERLGGVFVIDVPDLDAALTWAKRCPAVDWGSVEIRPVAVTYASGKGWYSPE